MLAYVLECQPYDPVSATIKNVQFGSGFLDENPFGDGKNYPLRLQDNFVYEVSVLNDNELGQEQVSLGGLGLKNTDGRLDFLLDYSWVGRVVTLKRGVAGASYGSFTTVFSGFSQDIAADQNGILITLRDSNYTLAKDLQQNRYAGTGGKEGPVELKNTPKPLAFTSFKNATPVLVDSVLQIYQIHDGAIISVSGVYDSGVPLFFSGNYANYAALVAANVPNGQYATCLAEGFVKLGAPPSDTPTMDGVGQESATATLATIVKNVLKARAGFVDGDFNSSALTQHSTDFPYEVQGMYYQQPDITLEEWARNAVAGSHSFFYMDASAKFTIKQFKFNTPVQTIRKEVISGLQRVGGPRSFQKLTIGYDRNSTVMTPDKFVLGYQALNGYLKDNKTFVVTAPDGSGGSYTYAGKFYAFLDNIDVSDLGVVQYEKRTTASWLNLAADGSFTVSDPGVSSASVTLRASLEGYYVDRTFTLQKTLSTTTPRTMAITKQPDFLYDQYGTAVNPSQTVDISVTGTNLGTLTFTASDNLGSSVVVSGTGSVRTIALSSLSSSPLLSRILVTVTDGTTSNTIDVMALRKSSGYGYAPGATRNSPRGNWQSGVLYFPGDTVQYLGASYQCVLKHTSTSTPPANGDSRWVTFADKGTDGGSAYTASLSNVIRVGNTFTATGYGTFEGVQSYAQARVSGRVVNSGYQQVQLGLRVPGLGTFYGLIVSVPAFGNSNVHKHWSGITYDYEGVAATGYTAGDLWEIAHIGNEIRAYVNGIDLGRIASGIPADTKLTVWSELSQASFSFSDVTFGASVVPADNGWSALPILGQNNYTRAAGNITKRSKTDNWDVFITSRESYAQARASGRVHRTDDVMMIGLVAADSTAPLTESSVLYAYGYGGLYYYCNNDVNFFGTGVAIAANDILEVAHVGDEIRGYINGVDIGVPIKTNVPATKAHKLVVRMYNNSSEWDHVTFNSGGAVGAANVLWQNLDKCVILGNSIYSKGAGGGWNSKATTREGYKSGAQITCKTNPIGFMDTGIGLDSTPTTDVNYTSIQYWLHWNSSGNYQVYLNGSPVGGASGSYTAGTTVFTVYSDDRNVYFYKDTTLITSVSVATYGTQGEILFGVVNFGTDGMVLSPTFSNAGAIGVDAKTLYLTSDKQFFTFDGTGAASPGSQTITFTVRPQNLGTSLYRIELYRDDGTPTQLNAYTYLTGSGTVTNNGDNTFNMTGTTITLTVANMEAARGSAPGLIVKASHALGVADTVQIGRQAAGSNGIDGLTVAPVAPISVACFNNGNVKTGELPRNFNVVVYNGTSNVSGSATYSVSNTGGTIVNNGGGSFTFNAISAETGYSDITITHSSRSVVVRVQFSKARDGGSTSTASSSAATSLPSSTSYSLLKNVSLVVPAGATINANFSCSYEPTVAGGGSPPYASYAPAIYVTIQNTTDPGTETDVSGVQTGTLSEWLPSDISYNDGYVAASGSLTNTTGLTKEYTARVYAKKSSGSAGGGSGAGIVTSGGVLQISSAG